MIQALGWLQPNRAKLFSTFTLYFRSGKEQVTTSLNSMAEAQGTISGAPTTMAGKFQVTNHLIVERTLVDGQMVDSNQNVDRVYPYFIVELTHLAICHCATM